MIYVILSVCTRIALRSRGTIGEVLPSRLGTRARTNDVSAQARECARTASLHVYAASSVERSCCAIAHERTKGRSRPLRISGASADALWMCAVAIPFLAAPSHSAQYIIALTLLYSQSRTPRVTSARDEGAAKLEAKARATSMHAGEAESMSALMIRLSEHQRIAYMLLLMRHCAALLLSYSRIALRGLARLAPLLLRISVARCLLSLSPDRHPDAREQEVLRRDRREAHDTRVEAAHTLGARYMRAGGAEAHTRRKDSQGKQRRASMATRSHVKCGEPYA
jgi:hypothetical protein